MSGSEAESRSKVGNAVVVTVGYRFGGDAEGGLGGIEYGGEGVDGWGGECDG